MWTTERLPRANHIILSIKQDGRVKGSITFLAEEQGDIEEWEKKIKELNEKKK